MVAVGPRTACSAASSLLNGSGARTMWQRSADARGRGALGCQRLRAAASPHRLLVRYCVHRNPAVRAFVSPLPYFTNTLAPQCKRRWRFSAPIYNENITRRCRPYLYHRSSNRFRPTIEYEGGYDTTAGLCSVY